jgi:2-hydroxychromene-2-carboxylate isomerase
MAETAAAARHVDCFLSMASPWAYLGHAEFMAIARRRDASVSFLPLPFRLLFPETGGLPLPKRHPVRRRYRIVELQRWRALRGLPLNIEPKGAPMDPEPLDRLVIAIQAAGHDPDGFMRRVFSGYWAEDRDLGDRAVRAELLAATGLPPDLIEAAQGPEVGTVYKANLRRALEDGVFGAPSYVLRGEIFWGQDRLPLLEDALASGRPAFRAE